MPPKIVFDARLLHTGFETYILNLLAGLPTHASDISVRTIVRPPDAQRVQALCGQVTVVDVPVYSLREQWAIAREARGADLLHVPHYNAPLFHRGKLLVSILDLIHITDSTYRRSLAAWAYARPMLHLVARKALHIITISEYSKTEIVEHLHVPPSRVSVIYCGVSPHFHRLDRAEAFSEVSAALSIQGPYLLYVGNLKPHKNVGALLQAFALLCARREIVQRLLIVGDDRKWKPGLVAECARLGLQERVSFLPRISYDLLPKLYAAAELLVLPSWIEGFGLRSEERRVGKECRL